MLELLAQIDPSTTPPLMNDGGGWDWGNVLIFLVASLGPAIGVWYKGHLDQKKAKQEADDKLQEARAEQETKIKEIEANLRAEMQKSENQVVQNYYAELRSQQLETFKTLSLQVDTLIQENTKLQAQVSELQKEVHELRQQVEYYEENPAATFAREILKAFMDNAIQTPAWIHDVRNNKWYLNDAYCETFNVNRKHFWDPVNILGLYNLEDAQKYMQHDMQVIDTNTSIDFTERVREDIMNPKCTKFITAKFRKVPYIHDETPYVFGKLLEVLDDDENRSGTVV